MNSPIAMLAILATGVMLSSAGLPSSLRTQNVAQPQISCSPDNKKQRYQDLFAYRAAKSDQAEAVETAKKYLACPGDPEDLAYLNFAIGYLLGRKAADEEAIPYFIKAAGYESTL